MSQNQAILAYLQAGHGITALEALQEFQCLRLAARVSDLKEDGHEIGDCWVEKPNGKRFKRYFLSPKQQELSV